MSRVNEPLKHLRRNGIAYIALFFALGGTTYGAASHLLPKNSVSSAQVVNGSLQRVDLSAATIRALHGARGTRGAEGIQGPQGPPGERGPRAYRASRAFRERREPSASSTTPGS
jgi:hypothetical protein